MTTYHATYSNIDLTPNYIASIHIQYVNIYIILLIFSDCYPSSFFFFTMVNIFYFLDFVNWCNTIPLFHYLWIYPICRCIISIRLSDYSYYPSSVFISIFSIISNLIHIFYDNIYIVSICSVIIIDFQ